MTDVVLREADQDAAEIVGQATKIGYSNLAGEITGGMDAWRSVGAPTETIPLSTAAPAVAVQVLDIRRRDEFEAGHVPGAQHIELGELTDRIDEVADRPTVVMCGHGERAMGAASMLAQAGHQHVQVLEGGPQDWADANDQKLEQGW